MGFGIMFLGYFIGFIMFLGRLSYLRVLGGIIVGYSAYKLRSYNRKFDYLVYASLINTLFYAVLSCFDILELVFNRSFLGQTFITVLAVADIPITFIFHACLLLSVRDIAKETDSEKILFSSTRNLIFYCILFLFQMVTLLPFSITRNLSVLAMLFSLILSVFNLVLIFKCYAGICDQSDIDMERKPSKFAFINKQRAEFEERRRKADEQYLLKKSQRENNRKQKRRK